MKITIIGSSSFRGKMRDYKAELEKLGHTAIVHEWYLNGKMDELEEQRRKEHAALKKRYNFIKWYYDAIVGSDAVLVLNFDKNGISNYIGGNTLMEMGFAHVHGKKVFLLNQVPEIGYKDEIQAMLTEVLNGDLSRIK